MPAPSHRICYDRILTSEAYRHIEVERDVASGTLRAISPIGKRWPVGAVLRVGFLGVSAQRIDMIQRVCTEWTKYANLDFEFTRDGTGDIRITNNETDGSWSYIGTDAKGIHSSRATMNFGWLDDAVILHEAGHSLGLAHEHSNPTGGILWDEEVVIRELSGPPNYWDIATIRHNVFYKYSLSSINGTAFDPDSVMLYSFPPHWTTNGFSASFNDDLSDVDKAFIASTAMYPGRSAVPPLIELPVNEVVETATSIGQAGEEDLYLLMAAQPGVYTIETSGPTDMYMSLYKDTLNNLIARDDDSGLGRNSKIVKQLEAGEYYVQVRHYNRASGTGQYAIRVTRN